jgi:hypothetical protein
MKEELSNEELDYNQNLYEETLALEFPDEDMKDKHFMDKVFRNESNTRCEN